MDDFGDPDENPITGEDIFLPSWYVDEHNPPEDSVSGEGFHNFVIADVNAGGGSFRTMRPGGSTTGEQRSSV